MFIPLELPQFLNFFQHEVSNFLSQGWFFLTRGQECRSQSGGQAASFHVTPSWDARDAVEHPPPALQGEAFGDFPPEISRRFSLWRSNQAAKCPDFCQVEIPRALEAAPAGPHGDRPDPGRYFASGSSGRGRGRQIPFLLLLLV